MDGNAVDSRRADLKRLATIAASSFEVKERCHSDRVPFGWGEESSIKCSESNDLHERVRILGLIVAAGE